MEKMKIHQEEVELKEMKRQAKSEKRKDAEDRLERSLERSRMDKR